MNPKKKKRYYGPKKNQGPKKEDKESGREGVASSPISGSGSSSGPKSDQPNKPSKPNRYRGRNNYQSRRPQKNQQESRYQERKPRKILGKCLICGTNVSDNIYGMSIDDNYIHFECMVKYVKNKMRDLHPKRRGFKVYYMGSGNFGAVIERNIKGNLRWEIIYKVNIKEAIEPPPNSDTN
jgi:hypothetical protein